jgi:hypothetical protein
MHIHIVLIAAQSDPDSALFPVPPHLMQTQCWHAYDFPAEFL